MLPTEPWILAVTVLVLLAAFFVKGVSGFGPALVSIPLLSLFWPDPREAVLLFAPLSAALNAVWTRKLWTDVERPALLWLALGLLLGTPAGTWILGRASPDSLRLAVGITVLGALAVLKWGGKRVDSAAFTPPRPQRSQRTPFGAAVSALVVGVFAGTCGAAVAIDGPPMVLVLQATVVSKERRYATIMAAFTVSGTIRTGNYVAQGLLEPSHWLAAAIALPVAWAGMRIGYRVHQSLSARAFDRVVAWVLLGSALAAVGRATLG